MVTRYAYDALNRTATVTHDSRVTRYAYDRDSRLSSVTFPNNTASSYEYDLAGRTAEIHHTQNGGTVSRFEYDYDDNGNRSEQIETNGGAPETTTYDYDLLDRLTEAAYPELTATYGYDLVSNRTTEREIANVDGSVIKDRSYDYNTRDQLETVTDLLDAANSVSYTFDAAGNQRSRSQGGVTTDFVFDARNDLRRVVTGGSTVGQFLYDPDGMRVEKLGARGRQRYTYDDASVLIQRDDAGTTSARYAYGPFQLLSLDSAAEGLQFYLTDVLNSTVDLTHEDGSVQARYQYDAWGNERARSGDSFNRFTFTGYEEDTESGLFYAKARFYDPEVGRFLNHDPFEGEANTPPSLHRYLYAFGNPTYFVDPSGMVVELVEEDFQEIDQLVAADGGTTSNRSIIRALEASGAEFESSFRATGPGQFSFEHVATLGPDAMDYVLALAQGVDGYIGRRTALVREASDDA